MANLDHVDAIVGSCEFCLLLGSILLSNVYLWMQDTSHHGTSLVGALALQFHHSTSCVVIDFGHSSSRSSST